jgi:hypothetical protein
VAAQSHVPAPQPLVAAPRPKTAVAADDLAARPAPARPMKGQAATAALQSATQLRTDPNAALGARVEEDSADADASAETLSPPPGQEAAAHRADAVHASLAHAVRGSPQTVAHLSAEIARKLEAQSTRFQVELEPAGLGKVEVKVEIGASGAMTAALNCDNAHAVEALRSRSGELQAALEQAGFDLSGGLSFTTGGPGQGHAEHGGRPAVPEARLVVGALDEPAPIALPQPARAGPGRLDIRI